MYVSNKIECERKIREIQEIQEIQARDTSCSSDASLVPHASLPLAAMDDVEKQTPDPLEHEASQSQLEASKPSVARLLRMAGPEMGMLVLSLVLLRRRRNDLAKSTCRAFLIAA